MSGVQGPARLALEARIDRAIEPFDTAGLLDRGRRDWYPVLASDILASSAKLGATRADLVRLLQRSGFSPGPLQENQR